MRFVAIAFDLQGMSMLLRPALFAAVLLSIFFVTIAKADAPSPFDAVHVYLITVGPGQEVYEKFGHNMIRVVGPGAVLGQREDVDVAFNWGIFSFEQPHFIWRFIQGRMLYSGGAAYYAEQFAEYQQDDRSMWQQELNLSADQKQRLWHILLNDIQPENINYRYDYYRDNCSTRTRDALDQALEGLIRRQLEKITTHTTFRWHTRRLMRSNFWLYTGLQYILGHPVDKKIDAWQECFLPVRMMDALHHITVIDSTGKPAPLVLSQRQLFQSSQYFDAKSPPRWIWIYGLIGLALAVIFLMPCWIAMRWWLKIPWGMVSIAWCILGSAAGTILVWGTFYTDHVVIRRNENLLQLSPIMMPLIVLIPFALCRKRWAIKTTILLIALQALCNLIGLLLKIIPSFNQPNWEIIALALPANIALTIGLAMISRRIQSGRHGQ